MYKILTSPKNKDMIDSALLHNEEDYLSYIADKNFIEDPKFKDIMFGKPKSYPAILVTHFRVSFNWANHQVYGEYIYPYQFELENKA